VRSHLQRGLLSLFSVIIDRFTIQRLPPFHCNVLDEL
jgi:hypothetical protein